MKDSTESFSWTGLLSEYVVFVDPSRVNLHDLLDASGHVGSIVRCDGSPADSVYIHVSPRDQFLGCVGGMISEDA